MNRSEFLTPDQLVDRWGNAVGRGTLANWRAQRRGPPYVKVGARVVYPIDQLVEFEQQNMAGVPVPKNSERIAK
jgi:hypothetical protein